MANTTPGGGRRSAPKRSNGAARRNPGPPQLPSADRRGFGGGRPGFGPDAGPGPGILDEMMMGPGLSPEEAIATWVESVLARGPIDRIRLTQKTQHGESPVHEWDVAEEMSDLDAGSIAQLIYSRAMEDASGLTTLGRYVALAYRPGKDVHCGRHFFRIAGDDLDGAGFESEEGHTPGGHMAQAHRHSEAATKLLLNGVDNILRTMSRQMARMSERDERFGQIQAEFLLAQQRLLDRDLERQLRLKSETIKIEQQGRTRLKIEGFLSWALPEALRRYGFEVPAGLLGAPVPPMQLPPAGQPATAPTTIPMTAEECTRLEQATRHMIEMLARLDDASFQIVLGRIDERARNDVIAMRGIVRVRLAEDKPLTADEAAIAGRMTGHMLGVFVDFSDAEFGIICSKVDEETREQLTYLRRVVRERVARQQQAQTAPAQPTTAGTT